MRRDQLARLLAATLPSVDPTFRGDANETLAMARQLEYFFAKIYEVEYPDSVGRKLIPIDTSVPTGARAHTFRMFDDVGQANVIEEYSDDLPMVDSYGKEFAQKIIGLGAAFFVSIQDIRSAQMLGVDIDTRKAISARKILERKLDSMLCNGDTATSLPGFATSSDVPLLKGAGSSVGGSDLTGGWGTATAAQIQADIEKMCKAVFDNTLGVHGNPDTGSKLTLALPPLAYSRIATLRIDTFNMLTVLEYEKLHNPFIQDIVSWSRLAVAGELVSSAATARAVAYSRDPDVLSGIIPQDFEMLPMQPKSLGYTVPCHMRFGGVTIRYPKAMVYADGIL